MIYRAVHGCRVHFRPAAMSAEIESVPKASRYIALSSDRSRSEGSALLQPVIRHTAGRLHSPWLLDTMSACLAGVQAYSSRHLARQAPPRSRQAAGGRHNCAAAAAAGASSREGAPPGSTSLIPETLELLATDEELQQLHARVAEVGQVRCTEVAGQQGHAAGSATPFLNSPRAAWRVSGAARGAVQRNMG